MESLPWRLQLWNRVVGMKVKKEKKNLSEKKLGTESVVPSFFNDKNKKRGRKS